MGQIAAIIKRKTAEANARLRAMSEAGKPLADVAKKFERIEQLAGAVRGMHRRVGERLTALVRLYVSNNYDLKPGENDSRDGYSHGDLERAVRNADVVVGLKGIYVRLGKNASPKVYTIGGALQYGAVRGSSKQGRARTKEKARMTKRAAGNNQATVGKVTVVRAHPFFKINTGQVLQLEAKYKEYMQNEIDAFLRK